MFIHAVPDNRGKKNDSLISRLPLTVVTLKLSLNVKNVAKKKVKGDQ